LRATGWFEKIEFTVASDPKSGSQVFVMVFAEEKRLRRTIPRLFSASI